MQGEASLNTHVTSTEVAYRTIMEWLNTKGWTLPDEEWMIRQGGTSNWQEYNHLLPCDFSHLDISADVPGGFEAQGPDQGYIKVERMYIRMKTG